MRVHVSFEPIRAATRQAAEDAHLVFANQQLVAFLVPSDEGWYLQLGLGPCEREGLIFETLDAAEIWVRERLWAAQCAAPPWRA